METSRVRDWDVPFSVDKQVFLEALRNKKGKVERSEMLDISPLFPHTKCRVEK